MFIMSSSRMLHISNYRKTLSNLKFALHRYQYVLGERTWIEYWPTQAECQTEEHSPTCLGLEQMIDQFQLFGCQQ